jgi:hypothetical protein
MMRYIMRNVFHDEVQWPSGIRKKKFSARPEWRGPSAGAGRSE